MGVTESKPAQARVVNRSRDPSTGEERVQVSYRRQDGAVVEADTRMGKEGVTSSVSVTDARGVKDAWVYQDSFVDDGKDRVSHLVVDNGVTREDRGGFSPRDFLLRRSELFTDASAGVEDKPLGTYATSYLSAVLLSSGVDAEGRPAHALASLGVHAAFPFPGEHWDEGQLAILDDKLGKKLVLKMPRAAEETHLDLQFEDAKLPDGSAAKRIRYQGYMEDESGKLRFVQAEYLLKKTDVEKRNPSLWERLGDKVMGALNSVIGFTQNAKVLKDAGMSVQRLLVDGKEALRVTSTLSALDDGARFNALPRSSLLAINYAPPEAPLISSVDPLEHETRYRFDATLLSDEHGLLHKLLPAFLRRGTLRAHFVVDEQGRRRDVEEQLTVLEPPLSSKSYSWQFEGKTVATMTRDLVRLKDEKGNIELGFRETIRKA